MFSGVEATYIFLLIFGAVVALIVLFFVLKKMKGSIVILPDRFNYSSGETITGNVIVKLKKPVSSDKLLVGLVCERADRNNSRTRGSQSGTISLFNFNQPLEGTKEYTPSEYTYPFSITIPKNVSPNMQGVAGTLLKSAQIIMGQNSRVTWSLYAELKCKGINLSKKVRINVV